MEKKIIGIVIDLKSNEDLLLFLLLGSDGTINRMGIGNHSVDPIDRDMFVGVLRESPFKEVVALVSDDIIQLMGDHYQASVIEGEKCLLKVALQYDTGDSTGMDLVYGSESGGVPPDLIKLVTTAVKLTDPWHTKHKEMVRKSRK